MIGQARHGGAGFVDERGNNQLAEVQSMGPPHRDDGKARINQISRADGDTVDDTDSEEPGRGSGKREIRSQAQRQSKLVESVTQVKLKREQIVRSIHLQPAEAGGSRQVRM